MFCQPQVLGYLYPDLSRSGRIQSTAVMNVGYYLVCFRLMTCSRDTTKGDMGSTKNCSFALSMTLQISHVISVRSCHAMLSVLRRIVHSTSAMRSEVRGA